MWLFSSLGRIICRYIDAAPLHIFHPVSSLAREGEHFIVVKSSGLVGRETIPDMNKRGTTLNLNKSPQTEITTLDRAVAALRHRSHSLTIFMFPKSRLVISTTRCFRAINTPLLKLRWLTPIPSFKDHLLKHLQKILEMMFCPLHNSR